MSTPFNITDYMMRGLDAAKPATPSIPAGTTAFYYATDTLKLYGWSGGAWVQVNTGTGGPAIVQSKATNSANLNSSGITLNSAPTQGNLLIAFVRVAGLQGLLPGTGWNSWFNNQNFTSGSISVYWKVAGASESATQFPTTSTANSVGCVVYECSAGAPSATTLNVNQSGTAVAETGVMTKGGGSLLIGAVITNSNTSTPSSITGATLDGAASQGNSVSVQAFHVNSPVAGNNNITVNFGVSTVFNIGMVQIS